MILDLDKAAEQLDAFDGVIPWDFKIKIGEKFYATRCPLVEELFALEGKGKTSGLTGLISSLVTEPLPPIKFKAPLLGVMLSSFYVALQEHLSKNTLAIGTATRAAMGLEQGSASGKSSQA